jgi:hypothetical protein
MNNNNNLPDPWRGFIDRLFPPSQRVRDTYEYCLALLLAEQGDLEVTGHDTNDAPSTFQTAEGRTVSLPRPEITPQEEAMTLEHLRWLVEEQRGR